MIGGSSQKENLVDSSAALGAVGRKYVGMMRHVRVGQLWVEEKVEIVEFRYSKVKGSDNPADLITKASAGIEIKK